MFPAEILPIVTVLAEPRALSARPADSDRVSDLLRRAAELSELAWFPARRDRAAALELGLALILSALTVHFRDIKDILANVMTLWFFATPIIYYWKYAPESIRRFLNLNPFTHLAISYQEILFFPATSAIGSGCWRSAWHRLGLFLVRLFPVRPAARLVCGGSVT